jgi:NADPH:quinone reductase-like Zn-dependent oxidoreductase
MKWVELPDPVPKDDEILVQVKASGINFAETRMRAGTYSGIQLPLRMGMECAGIVEKVGPKATRFKAGDRVFGRAVGSHAEKVILENVHAMPLPDNLSFTEGAAIPVGWLTAWHALFTIANAQPGQTVLIESIASSVGSAALQIAKHLGCWVAGTASRDDKLERAKQWGLDAAYNYVKAPYGQQAWKDTNGHGIDIALMAIGESTAAETIASMAYEGRILMFGSTGGRKVCFDLGIGERNLQLLGMSVATSVRYFPETVPSFNTRAIPLFAKGTFKPVVDTVLPMADLTKAHQMVNDRRHYGKVIMTNP